MGNRTLFLGHTKELITQSRDTFKTIWGESEPGMYVGEQKEKDAYVICGSVQSVSRNIEKFDPKEFEYIVIDEAHHGTANTY